MRWGRAGALKSEKEVLSSYMSPSFHLKNGAHCTLLIELLGDLTEITGARCSA